MSATELQEALRNVTNDHITALMCQFSALLPNLLCGVHIFWNKMAWQYVTVSSDSHMLEKFLRPKLNWFIAGYEGGEVWFQ